MMKFAFSTLGCPGWTWEEILTIAKDSGFDGVEIRGIGREMFAPKARPFLPENTERSVMKLASMHMEISCLSAASCIAEKEEWPRHLTEGIAYIDLAERMGIPYVRILPDYKAAPDAPVDLGLAREHLAEFLAYAEGKRPVILMETNGWFAKTERLLALLEGFDSPNLAVLWDVHHPYRFYGEAIADTYAAFKDRIRYVHFKDSRVIDGQLVYQMMGKGDIPTAEILHLLAENGYAGYVSLEWLKRWNRDLAEPGIVFPHFMNYVRNILPLER